MRLSAILSQHYIFNGKLLQLNTDNIIDILEVSWYNASQIY
jgi:hypothetical protein